MQNQTPKHYMISKWSKGEIVERSMRGSNDNNQTKSNPVGAQYQTQQQYLLDNNNEMNASSAIQTSIHTVVAPTPDYGSINENGFTRQTNKRDAFNEILSHRDLHTQVGQNPFLAGESYLQHLSIQENFLRPQNTNVIEPKTNG